MKKIWKVLIIFEIIIFILFLVLWAVYEQDWVKEEYIKNNKNNFSQYGIYNPVVNKADSSGDCVYNINIQINPDKIAKNNVNLYKIPN